MSNYPRNKCSILQTGSRQAQESKLNFNFDKIFILSSNFVWNPKDVVKRIIEDEEELAIKLLPPADEISDAEAALDKEIWLELSLLLILFIDCYVLILQSIGLYIMINSILLIDSIE